MQAAVFIGAVIIMLLGVGILSGAVGTLELHYIQHGIDTPTYNICAEYNHIVQCMRIPESVMHFLNEKLAMPDLHP